MDTNNEVKIPIGTISLCNNIAMDYFVYLSELFVILLCFAIIVGIIPLCIIFPYWICNYLGSVYIISK